MLDIKELVRSSIPLNGDCSGIYFLFNNDELVYIGCGWNCFLRVAEHTREDMIFTSFQFIEYIEDEQKYVTREEELIAEFKKQFKKKPKYNEVPHPRKYSKSVRRPMRPQNIK